MNASQIAYETARTEFAAKSHAYSLICNAYRALKIGDAEFLAARKAFDEAIEIVNAAMDAVVEDEVAEAADHSQFLTPQKHHPGDTEMNATVQTKPTAQDAFTAEVYEIDALIAKLADLRADHFGVSPEAVNWGHVGSAKRTVAELRDILAHYGR